VLDAIADLVPAVTVLLVTYRLETSVAMLSADWIEAVLLPAVTMFPWQRFPLTLKTICNGINRRLKRLRWKLLCKLV
jgi:hypothetical protein